MALRKLLSKILLFLLFLPISASAQGDSVQVRPMDNLTFSGVPLIFGSLALRPSKEGFRHNNVESDERTQLLHSFNTSLDNYIQYAPIATATVLNMAGYEGHSNRLRYVGTAATSYIIMAGLVNCLKYTVKEMRPDGSTKNAWPSGHTATVFIGATILHHEYGLTRSPWFSVGGYTFAAATAMLRVMNNRHWVSDVVAGAGIGIVSTELAYTLADLIFKQKGINRAYRNDNADLLEHPSFIGLSESFGIMRNSVTVDGRKFKFGYPVAVGLEGAYLFHKFVGIGGRAKLGTQRLMYFGDKEFNDQSSFQTSFSWGVGPHFRYPLSNRLALATKFLVGCEHNTGVVDEETGDCLSVDKCITYGTGLSLTYAYKNLYLWSVFCDYDLSPRRYTLNDTYSVNKAWNSLALGARVNIAF